MERVNKMSYMHDKMNIFLIVLLKNFFSLHDYTKKIVSLQKEMTSKSIYINADT